EADHLGVSAKQASHVLSQFRVERLIHGGEDTTMQQARDNLLSANVELLGQLLYADALSNRDRPRDRQRLIRHLWRKPRRWSEALHRAFLHPTWNIALPGTLRRARTTWRTSTWRWRRSQARGSHSHRTAGRRLPRRMHGTACSRSHRRTLPRLRRSHSGTTLENRLTTHRHSSTGTLPRLRRSLSAHG